MKKKKSAEESAIIKNLKKQRNVLSVDENQGKVLKSSTAFFAQLQDEVKSTVKAKLAKNVAGKDKNSLSAVKLKL